MKKHSLTLRGHRTSISLEEEFWNGLSIIAKKQKKSIQELVEDIDRGRTHNLSSALRVFILNYFINHS